ncbi:uncharacterized protein ARMOST_15425 [Armillaria ostoyae]|uniref:Uncharacterized protein n=1 Tax=Armillaria ostoyae TaxID=47428 RepID=A0A284RTC1_ARMOS|nr:uncharacterized protein ARMOST_15425 [Armillaria ostoyae]
MHCPRSRAVFGVLSFDCTIQLTQSSYNGGDRISALGVCYWEVNGLGTDGCEQDRTESGISTRSRFLRYLTSSNLGLYLIAVLCGYQSKAQGVSPQCGKDVLSPCYVFLVGMDSTSASCSTLKHHLGPMTVHSAPIEVKVRSIHYERNESIVFSA